MPKKKSKMSEQDKALRDLVAYYEKLNQIRKANEKNKEDK